MQHFRNYWTHTLSALGLVALTACSESSTTNTAENRDTTKNSSTTAETTPMSVQKSAFGSTPDGQAVDQYTLTNKNGVTVKVITYGAIITSIMTPDKNGQMGDIVLGFDSLSGYLGEHPYFGAVVGRYGNRIANGKFTLNGKTYTLAKNNGPNHLHGGVKGFDKVVWTAEEVDNGVKLTHRSKDGDEGYPGNLTASVTYTLTDDNELTMTYAAQTDQATPVNITNHSYFNLAAGNAKNALDHQIMLNADRYVIVDKNLIPTGKLPSVKNTPMDFTEPHTIGERIEKTGGNPVGYDHTYVLNKPDSSDSLTLAARVYEPTSGREMDVYTTQPGVQFYSGNFLDGSLTGKNNQKYVRNYGFCLETQHFPDSPNQSSFPTTILQPGETYDETTTFKFSVRK